MVSVTVIIATYNSPRTLRCSIESVLLQTYQDFEIWVVGDACTDHSQDVVMSFEDSRVHWFNRATNGGSQSLPNNEGLARARGEMIAYLGHDDLWLPWHLQSLVDLLETEQADVVHSLAAGIGPEGLRNIWGGPPSWGSYDDYWFPPSSCLHRSGLGTWLNHDQTYLAVDKEYFSRLSREGRRIVCLPRLSALKLPSHWWGLYSMKGSPPQEELLEQVRTHPSTLEEGLIRQTLLLQAVSQPLERPPSTGRLLLMAFLSAMKPLRKALRGTRFEDWRRKRWRAMMARRRGLS